MLFGVNNSNLGSQIRTLGFDVPFAIFTCRRCSLASYCELEESFQLFSSLAIPSLLAILCLSFETTFLVR